MSGLRPDMVRTLKLRVLPALDCEACEVKAHILCDAMTRSGKACGKVSKCYQDFSDGTRLHFCDKHANRSCTTCNGRGANYGVRCPSCIGTGIVPNDKAGLKEGGE